MFNFKQTFSYSTYKLGLLSARTCSLLCLVMAFALSNTLMAAETTGKNSLSVVESEHFDSLLVADAADLPTSKTVFINNTTVSFSENWLDEFEAKTSARYRQKTKERYSNMLREQLRSKLESAGWNVVDTAQKDALMLNAQFKDLYITAPDTSNMSHQLVASVGHASIVLEVSGVNGEAFLTLEDKGNAGGIVGRLFETERALNYSFFNRMTGTWASNFVLYLDITMNAALRNT